MRISSRLAILGALLVLAVLAGVTASRARSAASPPDRYLVLIVMDGFRPDYMKLAPMHHLHMLMRAGASYSRAWVGQLETETPTGHATIVTGVYPRKHGVIGFGWRNPAGTNFSWMPTDTRSLDAGEMERLIESAGVPTISDLLHVQYPGSKIASLSGEKYYAADAMGPGADYILYGKAAHDRVHGDRIVVLPIGRHIPPAQTHYTAANVNQPAYPDVQDQFVAQLAVRLLDTVRPRALLVNLPGSDIEGHLTGGVIDRPEMRDLTAGDDKAIGAIMNAYKRAGLFDRTVFVVTADHGMVPNTHIVPREAMYAGVRATGALDMEDDLLNTAGFVYLRDLAQAPAVASSLAARRFPHVEGALYKVPAGSGYACRAEAGTARSLGSALTRAYLDLCDTMASAAGPDVVLPYEEDTMGLTVAHQRHWGNHGGFSWRTESIPLVMAGPGVRHMSSSFPAELVDIAPTLERVLGLPVPKGVDGVVLADALGQPAATDAATQRTVTAQRTADVSALLAHSLRQHGAALTK